MKAIHQAGLCLLFLNLAPRVWAMKMCSLQAFQVQFPPRSAAVAMAAISFMGPHWKLLFTVALLLLCVMCLTLKQRERELLLRQKELESLLMEGTTRLSAEQAQVAEAQEALRTQATRDALTGLLNRTAILEVLDREMARAVRDNGAVSVVLVDLDHFRKINETHGETAGDEVLKEVGRRLNQAIRNYDTAGRYGGEEFLLVLPNFEGDTGVERLRRIHDEVCAQPIAAAGCSLKVTCSFGVSLLLANQFYPAEELLERADQALNTAKHDGRNRIGFFARSDA